MKINPNLLYESGSNTNGNYVKYADGTMICSGNKSGSINVTTSWGALYNSDNISFADFAQTFIETPIVTITANATTGGYLYIVASSPATNKTPSTTNPGGFCIMRNSSSNNVAYSVSYIAIGKWK